MCSKDYDVVIKNSFNVTTWSKYKNKKNRTKIMSQIDKRDIEDAVTNIKMISSYKWDNNPSSNMDELIEKIKKIK